MIPGRELNEKTEGEEKSWAMRINVDAVNDVGPTAINIEGRLASAGKPDVNKRPK